MNQEELLIREMGTISSFTEQSKHLLFKLHEAHTACVAAEKAYRARGTNKEDKTPWLVLLDTWRAAETAEQKVWEEVGKLLTK